MGATVSRAADGTRADGIVTRCASGCFISPPKPACGYRRRAAISSCTKDHRYASAEKSPQPALNLTLAPALASRRELGDWGWTLNQAGRLLAKDRIKCVLYSPQHKIVFPSCRAAFGLFSLWTAYLILVNYISGEVCNRTLPSGYCDLLDAESRHPGDARANFFGSASESGLLNHSLGN